MSRIITRDWPVPAEDKLAIEIDSLLTEFIRKNPVEYNRYKSIISDEYFFILLHSSRPKEQIIDMLEKHLEKWGPDAVTAIKPLVWDH